MLQEEDVREGRDFRLPVLATGGLGAARVTSRLGIVGIISHVMR
jgi:hypothetical protein